MTISANRPTPAQAWVIAMGITAPVEGGYGGRAVITSFLSGKTSYGHQTRVVEACRDKGWLDDFGRATEAGRKVIS